MFNLPANRARPWSPRCFTLGAAFFELTIKGALIVRTGLEEAWASYTIESDTTAAVAAGAVLTVVLIVSVCSVFCADLAFFGILSLG